MAKLCVGWRNTTRHVSISSTPPKTILMSPMQETTVLLSHQTKPSSSSSTKPHPTNLVSAIPSIRNGQSNVTWSVVSPILFPVRSARGGTHVNQRFKQRVGAFEVLERDL